MLATRARMGSPLDLPGTLLGSEGHRQKTTLGSNRHGGQKPESQRHRKTEGKSGERREGFRSLGPDPARQDSVSHATYRAQNCLCLFSVGTGSLKMAQVADLWVGISWTHPLRWWESSPMVQPLSVSSLSTQPVPRPTLSPPTPPPLHVWSSLGWHWLWILVLFLLPSKIIRVGSSLGQNVHTPRMAPFCKVEEARCKRPYSVWFYVHDMARKGKSIEMESRLMVAWPWG